MMNNPTCPECNVSMGKAGKIWSGRSKIQRYRCNKCGRTMAITPKDDEQITKEKPTVVIPEGYISLQEASKKATQVWGKTIGEELIKKWIANSEYKIITMESANGIIAIEKESFDQFLSDYRMKS